MLALKLHYTKLATRLQLKRLDFFQTKAYLDFAEHRIAVRDLAALVYTLLKIGLPGWLEFQEAMPDHIFNVTGRRYSTYQIRSAIQTLCDLGYLTKPRKQDPKARLAKPVFITRKALGKMETGFKPRIVPPSPMWDTSPRSESPTINIKTRDNQSLDNSVTESLNVKNTIRAREDTIKPVNSRPRNRSKPSLLKNDHGTNTKSILWWIGRCSLISGQTQAAVVQGQFAGVANVQGNRFEYWIDRWKDATGSEKSFFVRQIVKIILAELAGDRQIVQGSKKALQEEIVQGSKKALQEIAQEDQNKALRKAIIFDLAFIGPGSYLISKYKYSDSETKIQILEDLRTGKLS